MWSRAQIKERGKIRFKANYWKVVLVAMFIALIGGGGSYSFNNFNNNNNQNHYTAEPNSVGFYMGEDNYPVLDKNDLDELEAIGFPVGNITPLTIFIWLAVFLIIVLIVMVIAILIDVYVLNPFELGIKRFSVVNLNSQAMVKEIGFGFDNCYKNNIRVLFFRDLYTFLWTLLFIIPGIVKAYEYRMIPYLLAENPAMTKEEAFAESKRMMSGNKWNAFVFDLSFIGWYIVSILSLGIAHIFYVGPYKFMANAALYEAIRYGNVNFNNAPYNN